MEDKSEKARRKRERDFKDYQKRKMETKKIILLSFDCCGLCKEKIRKLLGLAEENKSVNVTFELDEIGKDFYHILDVEEIK